MAGPYPKTIKGGDGKVVVVNSEAEEAAALALAPPPTSIAAQAVAAVNAVGTTSGGAAIATGSVNIIADLIDYGFDCHDAGEKIGMFFSLIHPSTAVELQMATGLVFLYHGLKSRAKARAAAKAARA